jgi:hypothetical protein
LFKRNVGFESLKQVVVQMAFQLRQDRGNVDDGHRHSMRAPRVRDLPATSWAKAGMLQTDSRHLFGKGAN